MINVTLLEWQSFLVNVVEAPVMVVVCRRSVSSKVITLNSGMVDIRDEIVSDFISIPEKHMNTVIVPEEVT